MYVMRFGKVENWIFMFEKTGIQSYDRESQRQRCKILQQHLCVLKTNILFFFEKTLLPNIYNAELQIQKS
jgi:hypothetical protein